MFRTIPTFAAATLVVAGLACVIGYWPTVRLAGRSGVHAMLCGAAIALLASWVGNSPGLLANRVSANSATLVLASTAVRSFVALSLALAVVLTGWLPTAPLLIWVAVSYVVLLPVDVWFALAQLRPRRK